MKLAVIIHPTETQTIEAGLRESLEAECAKSDTAAEGWRVRSIRAPR